MRYCGVVPAGPFLQLATLEEVRTDDPPIRLHAQFFEPGEPEQVAAELRTIPGAVIAVGTPLGEPREGRAMRLADQELRRRGVYPLPAGEAGPRLVGALPGSAVYVPEGGGITEDVVAEGAYAEAPLFETSPDGVFCALRGLRLPARRHPHGIQLRIEELHDEHVEDEGELWHRRIEEIDAAAAALVAHRFAVGHACWVGDPAEGVVVLPGFRLPETFSGEGVVPPVPRLPLPPA